MKIPYIVTYRIVKSGALHSFRCSAESHQDAADQCRIEHKHATVVRVTGDTVAPLKLSKPRHIPKYGAPIEHAIVRALLQELAAVGWHPSHVYDRYTEPDGLVTARTERAVLNAVFDVNESIITFRKPGTRGDMGVKLICGNGSDGADLISDYHVSDQAPEFGEAINRVTERLEARIKSVYVII